MECTTLVVYEDWRKLTSKTTDEGDVTMSWNNNVGRAVGKIECLDGQRKRSSS